MATCGNAKELSRRSAPIILVLYREGAGRLRPIQKTVAEV